MKPASLPLRCFARGSRPRGFSDQWLPLSPMTRQPTKSLRNDDKDAEEVESERKRSPSISRNNPPAPLISLESRTALPALLRLPIGPRHAVAATQPVLVQKCTDLPSGKRKYESGRRLRVGGDLRTAPPPAPHMKGAVLWGAPPDARPEPSTYLGFERRVTDFNATLSLDPTRPRLFPAPRRGRAPSLLAPF